MNPTEVYKLFRDKLEEQFTGYTVTLSRQSRAVKPGLPLISITPGNVRRPQAPTYDFSDDGFPGYYVTRMPITIDLFTNGEAVTDDDGNVVGYANTAMEELLRVLNYINSSACVAWCSLNDISILIEGEAQDITGLVNDSNYEYRARQEVGVYFTQKYESYVDYFTYILAIEQYNELTFLTDGNGVPLEHDTQFLTID